MCLFMSTLLLTNAVSHFYQIKYNKLLLLHKHRPQHHCLLNYSVFSSPVVFQQRQRSDLSLHSPLAPHFAPKSACEEETDQNNVRPPWFPLTSVQLLTHRCQWSRTQTHRVRPHHQGEPLISDLWGGFSSVCRSRSVWSAIKNASLRALDWPDSHW